MMTGAFITALVLYLSLHYIVPMCRYGNGCVLDGYWCVVECTIDGKPEPQKA